MAFPSAASPHFYTLAEWMEGNLSWGTSGHNWQTRLWHTNTDADGDWLPTNITGNASTGFGVDTVPWSVSNKELAQAGYAVQDLGGAASTLSTAMGTGDELCFKTSGDNSWTMTGSPTSQADTVSGITVSKDISGETVNNIGVGVTSDEPVFLVYPFGTTYDTDGGATITVTFGTVGGETNTVFYFQKG